VRGALAYGIDLTTLRQTFVYIGKYMIGDMYVKVGEFFETIGMEIMILYLANVQSL
jgi:hypothetical protein